MGWKKLAITAAPTLALCALVAQPAVAQAVDSSNSAASPNSATSPVPGATGSTEPAYGSTNAFGSSVGGVDDRTSGSADKSGSFFSGLPIPPLGYTFGISLRSQYDSNQRHIPEGQPVPPGTSKSDFRFSPLVRGTVNLPFGRQSAYVTGTFGKDFYLHNTNYDRQRILAGAGVNLAAGTRCQANISANYINQQSDSNSTLINLPNEQITKSYGASANCGGLVGISPSLSYRHSTAANSLVSRQRLDLKNDNITLSLGYTRPTLGQISIFGSQSFNRYPKQPLTINGKVRGADVTNLGVAYSRNFGPRLSLNGRLSRVHVNSTDPLVSGNNGLGYGLSGTYSPSARYGLTLDLSRNASASPNVNALYFIQSSYGASFNYQVRPSIGVTLSAHTSKRQYEGGIPSLGTLTEDRLHQYRAALNWSSAGGKLGASAFVGQQNRSGDRTGTIGTIDYKDTQAGVSLSFSI